MTVVPSCLLLPTAFPVLCILALATPCLPHILQTTGHGRGRRLWPSLSPYLLGPARGWSHRNRNHDHRREDRRDGPRPDWLLRLRRWRGCTFQRVHFGNQFVQIFSDLWWWTLGLGEKQKDKLFRALKGMQTVLVKRQWTLWPQQVQSLVQRDALCVIKPLDLPCVQSMETWPQVPDKCPPHLGGSAGEMWRTGIDYGFITSKYLFEL